MYTEPTAKYLSEAEAVNGSGVTVRDNGRSTTDYGISLA